MLTLLAPTQAAILVLSLLNRAGPSLSTMPTRLNYGAGPGRSSQAVLRCAREVEVRPLRLHPVAKCVIITT
jgi:hypothetical protein